MGSISFQPRKNPYEHLFVVPSTEKDLVFLRAVDARTAANTAKRYEIHINYEWQANTITDCVLSTILSYLSFEIRSKNKGDALGMDFFGIISAMVSVKKNEKAEKEGNINVYFQPGKTCDEIIKNGPKEYGSGTIKYQEIFSAMDEGVEQYETMREIEKQCRFNLSKDHGLLIKEDNMRYAVYAVAYTFIETLYDEILNQLRMQAQDGDPSDEKLVSVNLNDLIEIHGTMRDGLVSIIMRPGVRAKLLIKCDEYTEHTMGDIE